MQALKFVDSKLIAHDDQGAKQYGANSQPMTHEEWMAEQVKNAPHLFEPSKGAGASGGAGGGDRVSRRGFWGGHSPMQIFPG